MSKNKEIIKAVVKMEKNPYTGHVEPILFFPEYDDGTYLLGCWTQSESHSVAVPAYYSKDCKKVKPSDEKAVKQAIKFYENHYKCKIRRMYKIGRTRKAT